MLQAAGCIIFGLFASQEILINLTSSYAELDCFVSIGTYSVCDVTARITIYSNLFILMAQAFVSRVFVPGISIFVNASVRCPSNARVPLQSKNHKTALTQSNLICTAGFGLRQASTFCER